MSSFMSPTFIIGSIRIGSVESASCINMGNNWPTDFQSNQKTVQGFGAVEGDNNQLVGTRSMLNDSDFLDMLNVGDNETPEWLQEMITAQAAASGFTPAAVAGKSPEEAANTPQSSD
ncbi:hypothetical protein [Paenibacillus planticolens]|uniref:hypothetical protein n=1 Tax=Paenibacillus planticolens TaxID=2654976 RepID=UPI001FE7CE7E|nr:hypothetical protein [Paenibacillus planticolens]